MAGRSVEVESRTNHKVLSNEALHAGARHGCLLGRDGASVKRYLRPTPPRDYRANRANIARMRGEHSNIAVHRRFVEGAYGSVELVGRNHVQDPSFSLQILGLRAEPTCG